MCLLTTRLFLCWLTIALTTIIDAFVSPSQISGSRSSGLFSLQEEQRLRNTLPVRSTAGIARKKIRQQEETVIRMVPPDVAIRSSSDLPSLEADSTLEVYYAEQMIQELGTLGELVETYHSGLTFRFLNDTFTSTAAGTTKSVYTNTCNRSGSIPNEFTVQWYALDFPFGAFLPKLIPSSSSDTSSDTSDKNDSASQDFNLVWNNTAFAHYTPAIDDSRWTKGEQLVGTISGSVWNEFAAWTIDFCQERPGYQAFEVWDQPWLIQNKTKVWIPSNTCSSFTEAALVQLYKLSHDGCGSNNGNSNDFEQTTKGVLRRSYVPLISKTKPKIVNMDNAMEAAAVRDFYQTIQETVLGKGMSTSEFIRFLADKLDFFYVYDALQDQYLRVDLDPPYFALGHLYQPMTTLPWQQHKLVAKDETREFLDRMEDAAAGKGDDDFITVLSSAVEGSVDLLRRRGPSVLLRRLSPKLLVIVGPTLVSLLLVATLMGDANVHAVQFDASFVTGGFVGLVVGLGVSRLR